MLISAVHVLGTIARLSIDLSALHQVIIAELSASDLVQSFLTSHFQYSSYSSIALPRALTLFAYYMYRNLVKKWRSP